MSWIGKAFGRISVFKFENEKINVPTTRVSSSNIYGIGYDIESQTLAVRFKDKSGGAGKLYYYFEVPEYENRGLNMAESHGKYLNKYIKGRYRYKEMEG